MVAVLVVCSLTSVVSVAPVVSAGSLVVSCDVTLSVGDVVTFSGAAASFVTASTVGGSADDVKFP